MSDSSNMSDDDTGSGRPLSEYEQRRLHDITARLDLVDPGFGARMRSSSGRLGRRGVRTGLGRRVPPVRGTSATGTSATGVSVPESGAAGRADAEFSVGPLSRRGWNRLIQASVVVVVVLVLLVMWASGPWALLMVSLLLCLGPLLAILIYACRPLDPETPTETP